MSDSTISATEVQLTWTDNANNEDGFEIERCEGGGCTNFAVVDTAAADATTILADGLTSGATYLFRIRAFNASGSSGYSNVVSAQSDVPPAPTVLDASVKSGRSLCSGSSQPAGPPSAGQSAHWKRVLAQRMLHCVAGAGQRSST